MYDKPQDLKFINTYASPNFGMMLKAGASMQDKADKAELSKDDMEEQMLKVQSMSYDKPFKDALITEYEDAIAKNVEENGGSYYKSAAFIKKQRKKLHRDLTRGNLATYQGNYDDYSKWYTEGKEEASKNEINPENFELANRQALRDYETSRRAGNLDRIQLINMMQANDYHADALKISGAMEGNSSTTLGALMEGQGMNVNQLPQGHFERTRVTTDQLTPQEIYETVLFSLKSDPKYKAELDQGADLKMKEYDYYIKQQGKTFMEERGELTPKEKKQMEEEGFNSNDDAQVEKWARNSMRTNVRNEVLRNASLVASDVDDYFKQSKTVTHFKDDAAIKAMSDTIDAQAAAFVSELGGTLNTVTMADLSTNIREAKKGIETTTESILTTADQYGLNELLSPQGSRQFGTPQEGASLTTLSKAFETQDGFDMIVAQVMKSGLSQEDAILAADDLKRNVHNTRVLETKVNAQDEVLTTARNKVFNNIPESDWNSTYATYENSMRKDADDKGYDDDKVRILSRGEFKDLIGSASSEKELELAYEELTGVKINTDDLIGVNAEGRARATGLSGNLWQDIFNDNTEVGYNQFSKLKHFWKKNNDKVQGGIATIDFHRKLDFSNVKGDVSGKWKELSTADATLNNPSTKVVVGRGQDINGEGVATTLPEYLGIKPEDFRADQYEVKGAWITTTGKASYQVTVTHAGKTYPSFRADIPLRDEAMRNTAKELSTASDSNVSKASRAHLAIGLIDNFDETTIAAIGEDKPVPLSILGNNKYSLKKENGLFRVYILDDNNYPQPLDRIDPNDPKKIIKAKRHTNQVDALADIYEFVESLKK